MTADEVLAYCLRKPGAYADLPFGATPVCTKVAKKIFAQVYARPDCPMVTLKCDQATGEIYRNIYPGTVVRGYHCPPVQQPYFMTVYLNGIVPDAQLIEMMDHAYQVVVAKLPRKVRENLGGIQAPAIDA